MSKVKVLFLSVLILSVSSSLFAGTVIYRYDSYNRLTEEQRPDDGFSFKYAYDRAGNRLTSETAEIPDRDGDGLPDSVEDASCTDPDDADTDDDGISDGNEDLNNNGELNTGETDPCNADSDSDGIQDGTEIGMTDPDTSDTDTDIFTADEYPATETDPLDGDTDNDGLTDGLEDTNFNGKYEPWLGETDPNDDFISGTVLHIRAEETDAEFTDSSVRSHDIANNPDTAAGVRHDPDSIEKLGDYSAGFDGLDDYLSIPYSGDWHFGSGNFTVDLWVNFSDTSSNAILINQWEVMPAETENAWTFQYNGNDLIFIYSSDDNTPEDTYSVPWDPAAGRWYHVAAVRNGDNIKLFVNGTSVLSEPMTGSIKNAVTSVNIGGSEFLPSDFCFSGLLDDIRMQKGVAMSDQEIQDYFEDNKPGFLVLRIRGEEQVTGGTFTESSPSAHTVTNNNAGQQDAVTKFGSAWEFDGYDSRPDSYLEIPDHEDFEFGSEDFTVDLWVYPRSYHFWGRLIDKYGYNSGLDDKGYLLNLSNESGQITFSWTEDGSFSTTPGSLWSVNPVPLNEWTHVAVVRTGSTIKMFFNGKFERETDFTGSIHDSSFPLTVGRSPVQDTHPDFFNGYLDEIRIVKGYALWTENFSPEYTPGTKLLIHSNTTEGDTVFFDSSGENHAVVPQNGTMHTETASRTGNSSVYFDATDDYLEIPAHDADFNLADQDFTIDMWINAKEWGNDGGWNRIMSQEDWTGENWCWNIFYNQNRGEVTFNYSQDGQVPQNPTPLDAAGGISFGSVSADQWHHLAVVRDNNTVTAYLDGIQKGSGSILGNIFSSSRSILIGAIEESSNHNFSGYLDEIRIQKGIAMSQAEIGDYIQNGPGKTVLDIRGEEELSGDTFTESSESSHTVTSYSAVRQTGKFEHGWNFNGYDQYLETADSDDWNFGSDDFTIDFWINGTFTNSWARVMGQGDYNTRGDLNWYFQSNDGSRDKLWFIFSPVGNNSSVHTLSVPFRHNTWQHIAVVRTGSTMKMFTDGKQADSLNFTGSMYQESSLPLQAGVIDGGYSYGLRGSLDEIRIVKGRALWTEDFTPKYIPGTKLLVHSDNADGDGSITDSSGENHQIVRGNSIAHSTDAPPKIGSSSVFFNGSNQYLELADSDDWNFGAEDFTLSVWVYPTAYGYWSRIFDQFQYGGSDSAFMLHFNTESYNMGTVNFHASRDGRASPNAVWLTSESVVPLRTWTHLAVTRRGDTFSLFVNGTEEAQKTMSGALHNSDHPLIIGGQSSKDSAFFSGYMDEITIVKGEALWDSDFVPDDYLTVQTDSDQNPAKEDFRIWRHAGRNARSAGIYNQNLLFQAGDRLSGLSEIFFIY